MIGRGSGRGVRGGRDSGRVGGMVERVGEDDFSDDSMVVGDGGRIDNRSRWKGGDVGW